MRAAVAWDVDKLTIEELEAPTPGPREVLVRIKAAGVCHTDLSLLNGRLPAPYPCVLGHEGAGIVETVGSEVTTVREGDHVVISIVISCGSCYQCSRGRHEICELGTQLALGGTMMDWTSRLQLGGETLNHVFCQSSFAEYAVVPEVCAVPVRDDAPLDVVALLGCGASTGFGAVTRRAKVHPGASVVVIGAGGVGLSVIMAARAVGAAKIIAVDVIPEKLHMAQEIGATHLINPLDLDVVVGVQELTGTGAEYGFDTVGLGSTLRQAVDSVRPGGEICAIGIASLSEEVTVDIFSLLTEKRLTGTWAGSVSPKIDIPAAVDLLLDGRLPLDRLVTQRYKLDELPQAFADMEAGKLARGVITF
jgi:Zn-dependent alcohol dehydrogenase